MFTTAPPPLSRSTGANAWAIRRGPRKLVSISARAASTASMRATSKLRPMPALLTTMETSPQMQAALAMSSGLVTSSRTGMTSGLVMLVVSRARRRPWPRSRAVPGRWQRRARGWLR